MKKLTVHELCLTAVMTAIVFLATFVPKVPIPLGYAHLGDAAIFLIALCVSRHCTLVSACLGSVLADLAGGFALWILPTLVIKYIMADIFLHFASGSLPDLSRSKLITGMLLGSLWMTVAYTGFGIFLYDSFAAGLSSMPGLLMEGLLNSAAAFMLAPAIKTARIQAH